MNLTLQRHDFSPEDTSGIEALGYIVTNDVNKQASFADFMRASFANFNLLKLLQVVEQVLYPLTELAIKREIKFNGTGTLSIYFGNHFRNESEALLFKRAFYKEAGQIVIQHCYFVLPSYCQRQGLAKTIFQESLRQYLNMDASKILVHAGLSGGGYTWAKHGFTITNRSDVDSILAKARQMLLTSELHFVEKIYDHYYNNPDPVANHQAFPVILWSEMPFMKSVLMGCDWLGQMDLKNREQMSNFMNYVFRI